MLAAMICAIPLIAFMQRDALPFLDEWAWLFHRESWALQDIFRNYNGHMVAITTLAMDVDRALFHAGAQGFLTAVSIAFQLLLAWLVFVYARRRIDAWIAFGLASLLLVYGSGYEVGAWSLNLGWVASLAFGMAAMTLYDRERSTRRDVGVSALLALSLMGCDIGLAFVAWLAVRAFGCEDRRRAIPIVGPPLLLWVAWYLIDVHGGGTAGYFPKSWPHWILNLIAYAFAGPLGLMPSDDPAWGRPLAVAAAIATLVVLHKRGKLTAELAALFALPISFWVLTAIGRGGWSPPSTSRFTYVGYVLLIPLGVELARDFKIRGSALAAGFAAVWLLMLGGSLQSLSDGSVSLRGGYALTRTHLTALNAVGRDVACKTRVKAFDFGLFHQGNCKVYDWLQRHGPENYVYSAARLRGDPQAATAVANVKAQMRADVSGESSPK